LLIVALEGMAYEAVAEVASRAVGTAKSRVFRARRQLQAWLIGETGSRGTTPRRSAVVARVFSVVGSAWAADRCCRCLLTGKREVVVPTLRNVGSVIATNRPA
jgi:hypothetical protein